MNIPYKQKMRLYPQQYRGFTINLINRKYRANSYCYDEISDTSILRVKKQIRTVLNNQVTEPSKFKTYAPSYK